MRYGNYLVAAAMAGLATAALTTGAAAQVQPTGVPELENAQAWEDAARAAGITNPDAIIQLRAQGGGGLSGLEQRGCVATDKVYGQDWFEFEGYRYGGCLARGAAENPDGMRAIVRVAQAIGAFRNNAYGFAGTYNGWLVVGDTVANVLQIGSGTWMGGEALVRMEFDLRIPGVRLHIQRPDGSSDIQVAADPRVSPSGRTGHYEQPEIFGDGPLDGVVLAAWKEEPVEVPRPFESYTPGASNAGTFAGQADMTPQQLLALAFMQPIGVLIAARNAAGEVTVAKDGQARDVMTIPVPELGANLVATLDATGRPIHSEVDLGGQVYSADFGLFVNDRMDMETSYPHQISIQVNGEQLADWDIEWHHIGPYLIFPVPAEVASN
jgi:hypothetical protein